MNKNILIAIIFFFMLTGCAGTMTKLGVENSKLKPCPKTPNCVCSQEQETDEEHFIEPIVISATPLEAKDTILKTINDMRRTKVVVADDNYIRVEFVSKLFRFVDDVEFYFLDTASKELTIHVRSASRLGHSDLGVNRKRIELIREKLKNG